MARVIELGGGRDSRLRAAINDRLQGMGFDTTKSSNAANLITNALNEVNGRNLETVLRYEGISATQLNILEILRKVS